MPGFAHVVIYTYVYFSIFHLAIECFIFRLVGCLIYHFRLCIWLFYCHFPFSNSLLNLPFLIQQLVVQSPISHFRLQQLVKKWVADPYFAEGLCMHGGRLYQLTWQHQMGFIYDARSLNQIGCVGVKKKKGGGAVYAPGLPLSDANVPR